MTGLPVKSARALFLSLSALLRRGAGRGLTRDHVQHALATSAPLLRDGSEKNGLTIKGYIHVPLTTASLATSRTSPTCLFAESANELLAPSCCGWLLLDLLRV